MNVTEKFGGQGTGFGYACSPTVVDDLVILPVGGPGAALVALNALDGSLVWSGGDQSASYTPALPITVDDQRQVIGYMENTVVAHELATGKQLWEHKLSQGYDEHAAWPIYHQGQLWIAAPFQVGSEVLKLSGGQGASAASVRKSELMSNDVASSVLVDGCIYGFDLRETQTKPGRPSRGTFRCIDLLSGDVRWSQGDAERRRRWPPRAEDSQTDLPIGHANVLVADGKLIMFNDTGELILARATPERYEELGRATILGDEICWTSPALHRGYVFVRNHQQVACVYVGRAELFNATVAKGSSLWSSGWMYDLPALATLMGMRASDHQTTPSIGQFTRWFAQGLGIFVAAALVADVVWRSGRKSSTARPMLLSFAFLAGAIGPLLLGRWAEELVFTWPVALLSLLLATVDQVPLTHAERRMTQSVWRSPVAVAVLVAVCGAFFYACREIGMPSLTIFLTGFVAALPLAAIAKGVARRTPLPWYAELLFIVVCFTAYYWASVGLLSIWA